MRADDTDPYRTVASYDSVMLAHMAAGRLQAEGLDADIADANYVSANWLMANALGGVKIRVPAPQAAAAREILARLDAGDYALESADTTQASEPAAGIACPACQGAAEPYHGWRWRLSMLLVHAAQLPVPPGDQNVWRCTACGNRWRAD